MLGLLFSLVTLVGVIWIVVIAAKNGDILWAIFSFLCGIVAIIYGVQHMDQCKVPLIVMVIGIVGGIAVQVAANAAG